MAQREMSSPSHDNWPAASPPKPNGVRFGLRDLFLAVTVVGVYLAAYVSVSRGVADREAVDLGVFAAATLVGTVVALVLLPRWARCRAGSVVARLQREASRLRLSVAASAVPLLVMLFVTIIGLVPAWHAPNMGGTTWPSFVRTILVFVLAQFACFSLNSVFRRSLAICRAGIVYDAEVFIPWRRLRRGTWRVDELGRLVGDLPFKRIKAIVPPDQRAAVEALLEEKLGRISDV